MTQPSGFAAAGIRQALRGFVIAASLWLGVRTWLALGLVQPLTVSGSSMAPTLLGEHFLAQCDVCRRVVAVGAMGRGGASPVACEHCRSGQLKIETGQVYPGERLFVDRTQPAADQLERWQTAVFVCPDTGKLCVKRVVGLPGETIEIVDGDVAANGRLVRKSLAEQHRLRRPVHAETAANSRWRATEDSCWQRVGDNWRADSDARGALAYQHWRDRPITDYSTYNACLARVLAEVHDLCVSATTTWSPPARLEVRLDGFAGKVVFFGANDGSVDAAIQAADGRTLERAATPVLAVGRASSPRHGIARTAEASVATIRAENAFRWEVSTFDAQLLVAVNGREVLCRRLSEEERGPAARPPASLTFAGSEIELGQLTLWRDVYYLPAPVGRRGVGGGRSWRLAGNEVFLLGDNSAVSIDSRSWGPASVRLLVGTAFSRSQLTSYNSEPPANNP